MSLKAAWRAWSQDGAAEGWWKLKSGVQWELYVLGSCLEGDRGELGSSSCSFCSPRPWFALPHPLGCGASTQASSQRVCPPGTNLSPYPSIISGPSYDTEVNTEMTGHRDRSLGLRNLILQVTFTLSSTPALEQCEKEPYRDLPSRRRGHGGGCLPHP